MTNIRLFAVVSGSVVITALVMGAITQPARADAPRTMECMPGWTKLINSTAGNEARVATEQVAWANQQLAAGRTSFGMMPLLGITPGAVTFCAW